MNFVICTYNFPPQNDAEAYCTARFASALARAGHHVHVVTMAHPPAISQAIYRELVDQSVEVTCVTMKKEKFLPLLYYQFKYLTFYKNAHNLVDLINAMRLVLLKYDAPILVSRYSPEASAIVAWHCRDLTKQWVAHFSDPFPLFYGKWLYGKVRVEVQKIWGRRVLKGADKITLTCENARRYFENMYGAEYGPKIFVTKHIGYPVLSSVGYGITRKDYDFVITHTGTLMVARHFEYIIQELNSFCLTHKNICFMQFGPVCDKVKEVLKQPLPFKFCINSIEDPRWCSDIFAQSDVNLVADLKINNELDYSPFLPSKFVYAIYFNRPIICVTCEDSEMAKLASGYGEGILFADVAKSGDLNKQLCLVYEDRRKTCPLSLKDVYTERRVAEKFISDISCDG